MLISWEFPHTTLEFNLRGLMKKQHPENVSSADIKWIVDKRARLVGADRKAFHIEKNFRGRPCRVPLLPDKNKKMRLSGNNLTKAGC